MRPGRAPRERRSCSAASAPARRRRAGGTAARRGRAPRAGRTAPAAPWGDRQQARAGARLVSLGLVETRVVVVPAPVSEEQPPAGGRATAAAGQLRQVDAGEEAERTLRPARPVVAGRQQRRTAEPGVARGGA